MSLTMLWADIACTLTNHDPAQLVGTIVLAKYAPTCGCVYLEVMPMVTPTANLKAEKLGFYLASVSFYRRVLLSVTNGN